ncbi:complement component 1 Q subcomponent-binding protein, mitochondrial [Episyrphus balteatus]|uniref:complement component 1 Q subcomponent-binding protein, mitochondrial n=1 Tax=Episyrphus balteatus TaxID=286459 RepID=UPI002486B676|nr:complement component 1 Q subcomponent-binding protein, mitochondrial [Episyrphus balteatus]
MSAFFRGISKISAISSNTLKNVNQVRSLSFLPKTLSVTPLNTNVQKLQPNNMAAAAAPRFAHTKSAKELVEFLTEEILAEKKAQNIKTVPTSVDGFNVNLYGADVELVKQIEGEKIIISFNVNHTVDADDESPEVDMGSSEKPDMAEMRSKPTFEVDIIKGNTTLSFTCSFLQGQAQEGEYNDVFGIDELCIFEGEWNEKVYAVAGDVLDGYLYDLLMNLLEEKGISNEFADKLADFSTAYEHASYIGFLERLSKFTTPGAK